MRAVDLTGLVFGRLTVVKFFKTKNKVRYWECECSCGSISFVSRTHLLSGKTKSCGCLLKEKHSEERNNKKPIKHGHSRVGKITRAYRTWRNMIQRCANNNNPFYKYYGEKGVRVCNRWMDFNAFLEDNPNISVGVEMDRIDVEGDYEPSNVRFVTHKQNMNNLRCHKTNGKKLE